MDIDAFSQARRDRWERLEQLARRRGLSGEEADELTRLYQATSGDLSALRSAAPEPSLVTRLSVVLANARVWLTGAHEVSTHGVRHYLTLGLAAAFYRVRWWGVAVTLAVLGMAALSAWWTVTHPESLALVGTAEQRDAVAQLEFESYYYEYDSASFSASVWTNNGFLALQCIALGITGLYPAYLMYSTVIQLGVAAAVMAEAGLLDIFFQLIIPHGLLELSAVFVAASAGMRLFWTMLSPGPRPRLQAIAEEGRTTISVGLGLVAALFVSGLIEGFVTGSDLTWPVKIVIGSLACAAFWMYIFVVGRYAVAAQVTGDVEGDFATDAAAVRG